MVQCWWSFGVIEAAARLFILNVQSDRSRALSEAFAKAKPKNGLNPILSFPMGYHYHQVLHLKMRCKKEVVL